MPGQLEVHAVHVGGMKVVAHAGPHQLTMDYPTGASAELEGFTPLQLLMASAAGCGANALAVLLRRSEQPVRGIEVRVRAERRDEHPTVLTEMNLEFVVRGAGVDRAAAERALALAEQKLCPVWAMLKPGTKFGCSLRFED